MSETLKVPRHLGLIPDGNRRWAQENGVSIEKGHREGYKRVREVVPVALDRGVEHVSVFGFSTKNWNRTEEEVGALMKLLKWIAKHEARSLDRENIKVRFAGSRAGLDEDIIRALDAAEERTEGNTRGELVMCINYGGRQEIVDALKSVLEQGIGAEEVDEDLIQRNMYVPNLPDMDLLVRTSGEERVSDFMIWEAASAELMFPDKLWPDFTPGDMTACLDEFAQRDRRHGS